MLPNWGPVYSKIDANLIAFVAMISQWPTCTLHLLPIGKLPLSDLGIIKQYFSQTLKSNMNVIYLRHFCSASPRLETWVFTSVSILSFRDWKRLVSRQ